MFAITKGVMPVCPSLLLTLDGAVYISTAGSRLIMFYKILNGLVAADFSDELSNLFQ